MHWRLRIQERWDLFRTEIQLTREQFLAVILLALLVAAGGFLTAARSRPHGVGIVKAARPKTVKRHPRQARLYVVHVAGAVARPGLYKLAAGTRLAGAIEAAGGVVGDGDIDTLNLASRITDGAKILVPAKNAQKGSDAVEVPADAERLRRLDLNTATVEQLDGLDGIGPVLAKRIIAWRLAHGSFNAVSQLDNVNGIGPKKLLSVKDSLTVEQP